MTSGSIVHQASTYLWDPDEECLGTFPEYHTTDNLEIFSTLVRCRNPCEAVPHVDVLEKISATRI